MTIPIFSRRAFLLSSSAIALSGCVTCGGELPALPDNKSAWISDAHAHFFNASDLPVAGFVEYVFIRRFVSDLPDIVLALIDLFITLVKPFAVSIERERAANLKRLSDDDFEEGYSKAEYAQAFKTLVDDNVRQASISVSSNRLDTTRFDPENNLRDSYAALAGLLNLYGKGNALEAQNFTAERDVFTELEVDTDLILSILSSDAPDEDRLRAFRNDQGTYGLGRMSRIGNINKNGKSGFENAIGTIKWAWLMMKSRCYHVNEYIRKMSSDSLRPSLAINLLVDYDKWLEDGPSKTSSHLAQIEFWHDYSSQIEEKLDIKTFVGYDPLKHAYEIQGGKADYFETYKTLLGQGKFSGFKLYPPMGFRAYGNAGETFIGVDGIKDNVHKAWHGNYPAIDLGGALDAALDDFFKFCAGDNPKTAIIPLLAHGGNSNDPARGFGERANPAYWHKRITEQNLSKLRLCIGHFTDARAFITGMKIIEGGGPAPQNIWALQGTAKLIKMSIAGEADVYADIGYMAELISDVGLQYDLASDFFESLFQYCKWTGDDDCRRLMYGSDWIMLGLESGHEKYLSTIESAMKRTSWGKPGNEKMMRNFLTNNLRRFLDLDPI